MPISLTGILVEDGSRNDLWFNEEGIIQVRIDAKVSIRSNLVGVFILLLVLLLVGGILDQSQAPYLTFILFISFIAVMLVGNSILRRFSAKKIRDRLRIMPSTELNPKLVKTMAWPEVARAKLYERHIVVSSLRKTFEGDVKRRQVEALKRLLRQKLGDRLVEI